MRIEVEPDVLVQSGQKLGSIGAQLGMLAKALGEALSSGIASGIDPAGANFGSKYGHQAEDFAKGMANATDAHDAVGFMLQATGYNYEKADAASTIGGSGPTGSVGAAPDKSAVAEAKGINGAMVPPPAKWALIQTFLGPTWSWPSGNASMMRITAAQWRNFANGLSAFEGEMSALKGAVSQQHIPEAGKIGDAITDLAEGVKSMAESATAMAKAIEDFACGVQDTQDAIRDLMDRLSLDGLWDTVTGFLTGDGDDILREVAHDVKELLENFQSQVKGVVGLLGELTALLGSAADAFEKWVRPILVEALGDDVGNAAADYITWNVDVGVGVVTGLINTVSGVVSLADLDTWKGMAEVALSVAEDPTKLPGVLENMGKQFVAWDKWSGDHPGRAAGEAAFNIGTLFVPGGALAKGGSVAKSLSYASRLFEEGRLPRISDLPGLGGASRNVPELEGLPGPGPGVPDVPEVRPAAIPESIVGPLAPNGIDTPSSPRGLEGPTGPPDPPGSTDTPGGSDHHGADDGNDPPPDPPGGGDPMPGPSAVEPQQSSEPPTPGSAPYAGDPTPDSPTPASPHDAGRVPSEPALTPANYEPTTSEARGSGHAVEQEGDRSGAAGDVGHRQGNETPNESHHPNSDHHGGPSAEHPNQASDRQPDEVTGEERASATGRVESDGDGRRQEPAAATPAGMAGAGMPMASHASGPTHTLSDGNPQAGRTSAAESTTRNPDLKTAQSTPTESTRAQQGSAAAGPTAGSAPTTSVNPASAQAFSGAGLESTRTGPEQSAPRPGDSTRDVPPTTHPAPHEARGTTADRPGNQPHPPNSSQIASTGVNHDQSPDPVGSAGNPADARAYGPHELRPVEDPAYQTAVEDALRDADGNALVHADPRTNAYGNLVNDGGPTVDGRSNNCLDCSLSALSSFHGDATVSAPRWPDELPDGTVDDSGERGGLRRAENWLGGGMLEFPGRSVEDQFDAVHQYVNDLGPGSAALVHNGWHARDRDTGDFLYHPDGSPVTKGSHATVVVYPDGAGGPVWWDPQRGSTSDHPPDWMTDQSSFLHFTPFDPTQGAHHGGAGNRGTGTGVSGGDVADRDIRGASVSPRMGGHEGVEPRADGVGRGAGTNAAGDRLADGDRVRVPELVGHDGGRGLHGVQADGHQQGGPPDIPPPMAHRDPADPGGRPDDRVSADGTIADRSTGTEPRTSIDDPQAHLHDESDRSTVDQGNGSRGSEESPKSGHLAGSGHERGVAGTGSTSDDQGTHHGGTEAQGAPSEPLRDYDSTGRTIPTDQLVHPRAGLLEQGLLDAAASNPNRIGDALSPGTPITDPEVQALVSSSYDPRGGMTEEDWNREYWPSGTRDAHGNPDLKWPDPQAHPQGFSTPEARTPTVLGIGDQFDRFGPGFGQFGSPVGTDFSARALPPHSLDAGFHRYEVVQPIPIWEGPIAPAMGQSGGGTQYYFTNSIIDLVNAGYLKEVPL